MIEAYLEFAKSYYAKQTVRTNEFDNLRYALDPLCELFGLSDANSFGPRALILVRQHMIDKRWSRKVINGRVNRIKRCFRWAVAQEMVSSTVLLGLQAVPGLRQGRSKARETEPIRPPWPTST